MSDDTAEVILPRAGEGLRAVFLDAGFTLLEPDPPVHQAYRELASALGVDLDESTFRRHLEACWGGALRALRTGSDEFRASDALEFEAWRRFTAVVAAPYPDLASRHEEWLDTIKIHFDDPRSWRVMPGAHALISTLIDAGVRVGVVSNWHTILPTLLESLGLMDGLQFVLTSAGFGRRKPHSAIFEAALEASGCDASAAIHIGDSIDDDVRGAQAVGIAPVLLASSSLDVPAGCTVVSSLEELPAILVH